MLALSLERLQACPESNSNYLEIRIYLDHSNVTRLDEVEYIRDEYFSTASIYHAQNHVLCPGGSWNILNALKQGWQSDANYIFLVEEDVMVRPEFFQRHLKMQQSGDFFVTSGRQRRGLSADYYTNPGCCFRREKLELIIPHICDEYFADQAGYIRRNFKICDDAGILDDGLIRRVMLSVNGRAMCAVPPIAFHQGFHYYQRIPQYCVQGLIQDKIVQLKTMLAKINPEDRYTKDFESFEEIILNMD